MARKMPQNLDAEMSVLGVCFLDERVVSKVLEEVTDDMFYSDANKKIFLAIKNLHDAGVPIDQTTVADELDKTKSLGAIGGPAYLADVITSVVSAANLDYYINIIKEKYPNWKKKKYLKEKSFIFKFLCICTYVKHFKMLKILSKLKK